MLRLDGKHYFLAIEVARKNFEWMSTEYEWIVDEFKFQCALYVKQRKQIFGEQDRARCYANLYPYIKKQENAVTGLELLHGPYWKIRHKFHFESNVLDNALNGGFPGEHIAASGHDGAYLQRDFSRHMSPKYQRWEKRLAAKFDKERLHPLRQNLAHIRHIHRALSTLKMPTCVSTEPVKF
jgi:hypothetical protein